MSTTDDLLAFANGIAGIGPKMAEAAVTGERAYTHPYLHAIFQAYDHAAQDPKAAIPSPLMAAIVNARRALGECAPSASAYAERRKYSRNRNETELSVDGRDIRPGQ